MMKGCDRWQERSHLLYFISMFGTHAWATAPCRSTPLPTASRAKRMGHTCLGMVWMAWCEWALRLLWVVSIRQEEGQDKLWGSRHLQQLHPQSSWLTWWGKRSSCSLLVNHGSHHASCTRTESLTPSGVKKKKGSWWWQWVVTGEEPHWSFTQFSHYPNTFGCSLCMHTWYCWTPEHWFLT